MFRRIYLIKEKVHGTKVADFALLVETLNEMKSIRR